jgi:hypothetical protein
MSNGLLNGYSARNISRFVYSESRQADIEDKVPTFERLRDNISQRGNDSFMIEGMGTLVKSRKQSDLKPDNLVTILDKLHKRAMIREHLRKQLEITYKIGDM